MAEKGKYVNSVRQDRTATTLLQTFC